MTTREEWFKHLYILTDEDDLAAGRRHKVYIEGTSPNLKRQIRAETIAEITNILDLWLHECTIKLQQLQKEDKNHKGHQSDSYRKGHEAAYDSLHKELAAWIIELKLHIRSLQSPPLSDQEKKDIAKSVKEIKEGKCKVIPSDADNATYLKSFDEDKPIRIQRQRTKGWKMPPNSIYVGRPTKWGNPHQIGDRDGCETLEEVMTYYHNYLMIVLEEVPNFLDPLKGKNLACWCPLDKPCHADILLKALEID